MNDDITRLPEDSSGGSLLSEGQSFGQYKVIRLLGRGGMGEVYEVQHKVIGTRHAIKLINSDLLNRSDALVRFEREAQVMARLRHAHIVEVDDFGETEGVTWFRMKLMSGFGSDLSVDELLKKGRAEERRVKKMLHQILSALDYSHNEGVIHRDIKPSNLLFDESGSVKITDYGLVGLVGADWLQSQVQLTVSRSQTVPLVSKTADFPRAVCVC